MPIALSTLRHAVVVLGAFAAACGEADSGSLEGTYGSGPAPHGADQDGGAGSADAAPSGAVPTADSGASDAAQGVFDGASGGGDASADGGAGEGGIPTGYVPSILVVGYDSLRILSRDLGKTWEARVVDPGSAEHGIQGTAYANGLYVAVGWNVYVSSDGISWQQKTNPWGHAWIGGLAYGNGVFVGSGSCGITMWSSDGLTWSKGPQTEPGNCIAGQSLRSAAFGAGTFAVGSDSGTVYTSKDATGWAPLSGVQTSDVAYCDNAFKDSKACSGLVESGSAYTPTYWKGHGVYVRFDGKTIYTSTDAQSWAAVYTEPSSLLYKVSFGYSPRP